MNAASYLLASVAIFANFSSPLGALAADGPVRRTTQYQGIAPGGRTYTPPVGDSAYDRYAAPLTANPTGVSPPPGASAPTSSALNDASNAVRQSFDSTLQQANDEAARVGSRMMDSARDAGQGFNNQLRDLSNSASRQLDSAGSSLSNTAAQSYNAAGDGLRQVSDTLGLNGTSPPPGVSGSTRASAPQQGSLPLPPPPSLPTSGMSGSTAPSWSSGSAPTSPTSAPFASTGSNSSPPPLAPGAGGSNSAIGGPRPVSSPVNNNPTPNNSTTGASWSALNRDVPPPPLLTPSMTPPESSLPTALKSASAPPPNSPVLGPQIPPAPAATGPNFSIPLVDPAAANGGGASNPSGWPSDWNLPPRTGSVQAPPAISSNDRIDQRPDLGDPRNNFNDNRSAPPPPNPRTDNGWAFPVGQQLPASATNTANNAATNVGAINRTAPPVNPRTTPEATTPAVEKPWMTLIFVSLSLIGSLSANFFLGWSYVDARQKYQTLVRKTADKFRRAAEAA